MWAAATAITLAVSNLAIITVELTMSQSLLILLAPGLFAFISVGMSLNLMLRKIALELETIDDSSSVNKTAIGYGAVLIGLWVIFSYIYMSLFEIGLFESQYFVPGFFGTCFAIFTFIEQSAFLSQLNNLEGQKPKSTAYKDSVKLIFIFFFIKLLIMTLFLIITIFEKI